MNTRTHPVAPEEVMAFLDGELSAVDAQAVSAHLNDCSECTSLIQQFRSTAHSLSRWDVEAIPAKVENTVAELATKTPSGLRIGKANILIRASYWTWKQWTAGLGATAALLVLLMAIAIPNLLRSRMAANKARTVVEQREQELDTASSNSGRSALEQNGLAGPTERFSRSKSKGLPSGHSTEEDRLELYAKIQKPTQVDGQPITDQQSKVPLDRIVTLNNPGVTADSNGLLHGLGDHVANSLSVDGQPITAAPMIARTVSISIVVEDFAASRSSLDIILARHHGYSAQLNVSTPENAPRGLQASLRIPAPELSSAVSDLKTIGRVENESQSGEEVTQQHTDLVARLKNSRETEQRFRTILQQRTGNAVEVLQVEEGIARVRGDIERMEAEQKALEQRVDFATVDLQLTEEYKAQLNAPAASVSTRVHNALVAGYRNASETVLGIVLFFAEYGPTLVIWLLILLLPIVLVWRRYRKTLATV
jgi:hypothetical protein